MFIENNEFYGYPVYFSEDPNALLQKDELIYVTFRPLSNNEIYRTSMPLMVSTPPTYTFYYPNKNSGAGGGTEKSFENQIKNELKKELKKPRSSRERSKIENLIRNGTILKTRKEYIRHERNDSGFDDGEYVYGELSRVWKSHFGIEKIQETGENRKRTKSDERENKKPRVEEQGLGTLFPPDTP